MKKTSALVAVLFVLFLTASAITPFFTGHTYTVILYNFYNISDIKVNIDDESVVKLKEIDNKNDFFKITFEALKEGDTDIEIKYHPDDVVESSIPEYFYLPLSFHVNQFNILFADDNRINFNDSGLIVLYFTIFLLITMSIIIFSLVKSMKKTIYSYRNIICFGLLLFFINILYNSFQVLLHYFTYQESGLLINLWSNILYSTQYLRTYLVIPLTLVFLLISISNVSLIIHEGKTWKNLLGVILGIVFFIGSIIFMPFSMSTDESLETIRLRLFSTDSINYCLSAVISYFDCMLLGAIICALIAVFKKPKYDKDFVIILGCGIKKDGTLLPLLKGRVDRAITFARKQKEATGKDIYFVPSGGQGSDEIISESQAMKNYLLSQGIDEDHIIMEDKSSTTLENMKFSKKIIHKINPDAKIIFSTTNYHIFRSGMLSQAAELNAEGIGSKTKWYFWPNAFLREFVGIICAKIKFHIFAISVILLSVLSMLTLYYFVF